jgi:phage protein D
MLATVRKTECVVTVDGQDISSALLARLINLSITDKAGVSSDTVRIELDDGDGVILLPSEGATINILLGSNGTDPAVVFRGVVDLVR